MPRPSTTFFLSLCAVAAFGGCRTIYSDMYSPKRNYFKPVKEQPKPSEVLPAPTVVTEPLMPAVTPMAPPPTMPAAEPPALEPAPAPVPGL